MAPREPRDQLELFPESGKVCSACGESKLRADFHRKRGARDGLQGRCKVCNIAGAERFHAENMEHCRARIGATKTSGIAELATAHVRWEVIEAEIAKCDVCLRDLSSSPDSHRGTVVPYTADPWAARGSNPDLTN